MCESSDGSTALYPFIYNTLAKALVSDYSYIPPEYSVIGCRFQTHDEASQSYAKISVMADPPVASGKSFELKSYARSWLPWKNRKPATMYEAIRSHDLKAIKSLLRKTPGLLHKKNAEGYTPLHFAATYGTSKIVVFLISQDADVNAENNAGFTPLDFATNKDILRKHGAKSPHGLSE